MNTYRFSLVFLCLLVLSSVTPNVLGKECSIIATADSYTDSFNPKVNYGGAINLYSYNYTYDDFITVYNNERHIWLKFNLSEIPSEATVNSIILRMHTSIIGTSTTNKIGVFLCSNTAWNEMTIAWDNCPQVTGEPIDTVYVGSSNKYYDFDVTPAVKGKNVVTLVLETLEPTDLNGWAVFDSKESSWTNNRPRLIVGYTTQSEPLKIIPFFWFLIVSVVVIIVVILVVIIAIIRKKEQASRSTFDHRFLGNTAKKEVHDLHNKQTGPDKCQIDEIIKAGHAMAFVPDTLEQAHKEGYDNCAYCIGGSKW